MTTRIRMLCNRWSRPSPRKARVPQRALTIALAGLFALAAAARAAAPSADLEQTDRLIIKYRSQAGAPASASAADAAARRSPAPATAAAVSEARRQRLNKRLQEASFSMGRESATVFGARVVAIGRRASTAEVRQLAQRIAADDPDIEYAVPDRIIHLATSMNDPWFPKQWALHEAHGVRALGALAGFALADGQRPNRPDFPLVAIIDTGYRPHVDLATPDFGFDYQGGNATPLDTGDARTPGQCPGLPDAAASTWHGLAIEGIIKARINNGIGMVGLATPAAGVVHARVFGSCGGYLSAYLTAIHDAVDYRNARGQRVRVINLSQAGNAACDIPLQDEISRAIDAGVAVVASAGNTASDVAGSSPANCAGVISVGATDRQGRLASYSNRGASLSLLAPGGDQLNENSENGILTTGLNLSGTEPTGQQSSDYVYVQGTSFSAPHVSATAALLFNIEPKLSAADVKKLLERTARSPRGGCADCGAGLLDARAAVERLKRRKLVASLCERWPYFLPACQRGGQAAAWADDD